MSNTPRARAGRNAPAARRPAASEPDVEQDVEQPPVGRQRGADPQRMIAHLARMRAEESQELAAAHALVDELEAENGRLREAVAELQAELVTATSGNGG